MIPGSVNGRPFELVVVAALRNKQLVRGCLPRVAMAHKLTTTARLEVAAGKVVGSRPDKVPAGPAV
jgi:DNA-directed RNA polymerase subunit K/omega